jgi:CheY-like chemotaxis protein
MDPVSISSEEELFSRYLEDAKIFVVDSSSASRTRIAKILVDLGATASLITLIGDYDQARSEMKLQKPKVVLSDYFIGTRSGLDLLQAQRAEYPDMKECLFILVTADSSQSAVASAVEEDVDTFILKPYTLKSFQEILIRGAAAKLFPSEYVRMVEKGKEHLAKNEFEAAISYFEKAMTLDPKPTLACFYHGQANYLRQITQVANSSYNKGLSYNRIHYKCLLGLLDLFIGENKHREAYAVVKRIFKHYPTNSGRLISALRLAVVTNNYIDIENYYRPFLGLDSRTDEVVKNMCAALVVAGRFHLKEGSAEKAFDLFDKAATSSAGRTLFLRKITEALCEAGHPQKAREMVSRFPAHEQASVDYRSSKYLVDDHFVEPGVSIQQGRDLIKAGVETPGIYLTLIKRSLAAQFHEHSEELSRRARQKWPEIADELDSIAGQKYEMR